MMKMMQIKIRIKKSNKNLIKMERIINKVTILNKILILII